MTGNYDKLTIYKIIYYTTLQHDDDDGVLSILSVNQLSTSSQYAHIVTCATCYIGIHQ